MDTLADRSVRLAHELNNLMQALIGEVGLVRRRAARGQDVSPRLAQLERLVVDCSELALAMRRVLEHREP